MSSGRRSDVEIKIESSSEKGNSIILRIYIKRKKGRRKNVKVQFAKKILS